MKSKIRDFNKIFWRIWGVNNRIHEPLDVFKIKKDKRAEEKKFNNFLNHNNLLSNEEYLFQLNKEIYNFHDLFVYNLLGDTKQVKFYVHQLINIAFNYKIFQELNLDQEKFINLFSFQIALVIEDMDANDINISMFENALKADSLMPFINKCKEKTKVKSLKDLAIKFSYKNSEMKKTLEKNNIFLEDIHANTFQKELSSWKNNNEYPSFHKMLVIINTIQKGNNEEKTGEFFQLLIIRALLYIQKEFNLDKKIRIESLEQISKFRYILKGCYASNNKSEIFEYQKRYVIDIPNFLDSEQSLNEVLSQLKLKMNEFIKNNEKDKLIDLKIPNREIIIKEFHHCKTKKDYLILLNNIIDIHEDNPYSQYINNSYNFVRFIISIKTEDIILFNNKFKYLDRSFGTLLSNSGVDTDLTYFIHILKNKSDLVECVKLIGKHFKKLSTLG